jgi:colanic acid biosynthesis protein WcaH
MLDDQTFETVISSTPLISIDLLVKKDNKILLGKRINKPAQGYLFSIGGRVYKNETINGAMMRIANNELNFSLKLTPSFIGVFEHFYDDGIYQDVSTHYVNLAYEIEIEETLHLPVEQHNEYQWLTIDELLKSKQVHKYVKDYFKD